MNDSRRPDPRRDACAELAELLATPGGARTARLLQLTGTLAPPRREGRQPAARERPFPISIWQPEKRAGEQVFVRPAPAPLGDHHAARREIPARKEASLRRVAFFGESAAAGYLYAPHFTPALALGRQLHRASDGGTRSRWEVIDLARTNETLDTLTATVAASLQLDPDVLVIFAGNNWNLLETPEASPYFPSLRGRQRYALALRGGLQGPAVLARRKWQARARAALATIAELAGERPVVLVIPEVNLADWDEKQPVPWLPGDGSARWYELYGRARRELAAGRFDEAAETAAAMAALDGGACPTSELLRARALLGLGDVHGARRAFEAQVAAGSYATAAFLGSPRASLEVAELLRRAAERHRFRPVDLPRIFAEHSGSPLPGRRLFLDYCHLTREAVEIAMAAVADAILGSGGGRERPAAREIPAAAEAIARLGAAIHGAHRLASVGDKVPWIEDRLREALAADPQVAGTMLDLVAARCAPCPEILTPAQQRALASPYRLLLQHGWRWDHLDPDLLLALAAVLEEHGHPARQTLRRLLVEYHGVNEGGRDLARPPYLWDPVERFYPEAMSSRERAFYRAAWPESSFCLIADGRRDVELDVTLRLPAIAGEPRTGQVAVRAGDRPVAALAAGESWRRRSLRLPRAALGTIPLRLTLVWPALPAAGDLALESARRRLELGVESDLHPVFGELFSLVARPRG